MKLHLGVIDIPYANDGGTTTYEVALWLEKRYGVMATFARMQEPAIAAELADAMAGMLENVMAGMPPGRNPLDEMTGEVDQMFRTFLDEHEIATAGVAGVPTAAAKNGVSHRFKGRRGSPRQSFIDTGLYRRSFKSFVEE